MNWSIRPDPDPALPNQAAAIGSRQDVKKAIQSRADIPKHWRDCLCAEIDALPAEVKAIKLSAYAAAPRNEPTFHIHLRKLY